MLLTLAIPTYNRAESLRATLISFAGQIEQQALRNVEIVVSDNCSTDATPEVYTSVAAAHPSVHIRYFRNATNLGFDGNVEALFGHAEGRYVWTFSDDDRPSPDALSRVVNLLRQREVRFAFVNYQVSVDGSILPSRFGVGRDRWLAARDLLKTIHFSNSLISACVFYRQAWLDAGPQKFLGTQWIHFFMAREILQSGEGLIVGHPLFTMMQSGLYKSRAEKCREGNNQIEFYMQAHLKFVEYASELPQYNFDQETAKLGHALGRKEDIHQVINFKLTTHQYSVRQIIATWLLMAKYRWNDLRFWCLITPMLATPSWSIKLARAVYQPIKKCCL